MAPQDGAVLIYLDFALRAVPSNVREGFLNFIGIELPAPPRWKLIVFDERAAPTVTDALGVSGASVSGPHKRPGRLWGWRRRLHVEK